MNNEMLPNDYREILNLIIQKIQLAQQKAVISANMTYIKKRLIYYHKYINLFLYFQTFYSAQKSQKIIA